MAEPPSSQEVYITMHVMGKIGHDKSVLFAHTQKENDYENVKEYYKHFYYIEFHFISFYYIEFPLQTECRYTLFYCALLY